MLVSRTRFLYENMLFWKTVFLSYVRALLRLLLLDKFYDHKHLVNISWEVPSKNSLFGVPRVKFWKMFPIISCSTVEHSF